MLVNIGTMHKYHIQENKQELQLPVAEVLNLDVILIILSVFTVTGTVVCTEFLRNTLDTGILVFIDGGDDLLNVIQNRIV